MKIIYFIKGNINYNNEFKDENDGLEINPTNSNFKINLKFHHPAGLNFNIAIDKNKTFKEAVIMFSKMLELLFDQIKQNVVFIYNDVKLNIEDERALAQIIYSIQLATNVVLDINNIIET